MSPNRHLALTLAALLLLPAWGHAQRRKLNGPLATAYLTDVTAYDLANGRIVYKEGGPDLLTVPLNGSAPVELVLHLEGVYFTAKLTPDGTQVVLSGALDTPNQSELYILPVDGGGPPLKLNSPLGPSGDVSSYQISPDGRFVVYSVNGVDGPYSVRTDGSQPALKLVPNWGSPFEITADSSRVLYLDYNNGLHTVPIDGSAPPHGLASMVEEFELAPDGSRVVYRRRQDGAYQLFSAPADGMGPEVRLNGPLVAGGHVRRFHVSRFSTHVTYVADQEVDEVEALYGVPIAGGPTIQFSAGIAGRSIYDERSSPDRSRLLYLANHETYGHYDLYSVPIDASQPPVNLSQGLAGVSSGYLTDAVSGRVVFRVVQAGGKALYGAPIDGSAPAVRLTPAVLSQGVPVDGFAVAAGGRAAFLSDPSAPGVFELFSAPLDGSAEATRLHPPLVAGGKVHSFVLGAGGVRALYLAEQDFDDVSELFAVPVDASAPPELRSTIREHLSTVGDVTSFALSPDGAKAVYTANEQAGNGVFVVNLDGSPQPLWRDEGSSMRVTPDFSRALYTGYDGGLYSLRIQGFSGPIRIAPAWGNSPQFSPDSSRVVHLFSTSPYDPNNRLFSTPVAGGARVELNLPRAIDGEILASSISPDSTRVVFAAVQQIAGVVELFSVPSSGGAAPVKLSGALVTGGNVAASMYEGLPAISPDSTRVVYLADAITDGDFELFSAPLAGGEAPAKLNPFFSPERDVTSFAISPDSSRVVYVADQSADEVYELYSVPLAGGGASAKLSAIAAPGRDVDSSRFVTGGTYFTNPFLISPDSRWVVYRADQDTDDVFDLYRAPLAGGAAPVRLTSSAAGEGTMQIALITPDSGHAVLVRFGQGRNELFRVALEGGLAPVPLSRDLAVTWPWFEPPVRLDDGGRWLLFHALTEPDVTRLFAAPLHGLHAPLEVSGRSAHGEFRPGTSSAVYIAEQDEPGVFELYIHELLTAEPGRHRVR